MIEAAARILESQGLDGFTTNAVAEKAGVSIGTLYQYFPDKDALLGSLIARETALLLDDAEAARSEPAAQAALIKLISAAVTHQLRRPVLARTLDFEEARLPFDPDTQAVRGRFHAILAEVLSRPDLPPQADFATATVDVAAILRGMVDAAGEREETEQGPLLARVRRAVFGYLEIS